MGKEAAAEREAVTVWGKVRNLLIKSNNFLKASTSNANLLVS